MYLAFIGPRHLIYHPPRRGTWTVTLQFKRASPSRNMKGQTGKVSLVYNTVDLIQDKSLERRQWGRQTKQTKNMEQKFAPLLPRLFGEKLCIRFSLLKVPFTITRKIDANKASYWRPIVSLQWDVINKSDVKCIPLCGELHQSLTHVNDEQ